MSDIARFPVYDLHSHTRASDGLLTPAALVQRAVEMRVGVLAITDHDSVAGVDEAQQTAIDHDLPIKVLAGAEISTLWENHEIHIVGLNINIRHPAMVAFLAGQHACRQARAEEIGERLAKARIPDALAGATRLADGGIITRGHFARFLIEQGKAENMAQVFKNYLARGKTGYVPPQWCTIKQAIDAIHHSGGCAVLAHPGVTVYRQSGSNGWSPISAKRAAMRWKSRSASSRLMSARRWRNTPEIMNWPHHKVLIFINPVRGLNWAANSGCPRRLSRSGNASRIWLPAWQSRKGDTRFL